MRRATAWFVVVGLAILGSASPARASSGGFWFSVATGVAGSATPTGYEEWWFETPHGPPQVAVTSLTGPTAQATTATGNTFFSGVALPAVLSPTDGYTYIASGNQPSDLSQALKRQMAGGVGLASAAPQLLANPVPATADLLSISQGTSAVTVNLTDSSKTVLANATVNVPSGGWWVIGLGPNPNDSITTTPVPVPTPPATTPNPGTTATPEPATAFLTGIGGLGALGLRLFNRRRRF